MKLKRVPLGGEQLDVVKVEDLPKLMRKKLKKVVCKHGREQPVSKVPKVQLKSRIRYQEWPPTVFNLRITELEPIFVDNGILSRSCEEAKQVKKTKRRRAKLPEKPETQLEKYEPYEEPQKSPEEGTPDKPSRVKEGKAKPQPAEPEQHKLVMGKGKVPQPEEEKEEVKLKKIPRKEPEEKPEDSKKPKKPKPEKPLHSEPGVDYRLKLKPSDDIPSSEGPEPDQPPIIQKEEDTAEESAPVEPKKVFDKPQKQLGPDQERKIPLGKGKPKPEPTEKNTPW
uniref:Titin n=1 Tax=Lygus hesperus TaxID=30085 RepID=A0A0A9W1Z2_LYGHE